MPRHQARSLQSVLHAGVAQFDAVLLAELLVKVPDVQVGLHLLEQLQHLLGGGKGTRLSLGLPLRRSASPEYPPSCKRSRQRRIVRSVTPMISTASHKVILFAIGLQQHVL